jgi:hypothetical protein
MAASAKYITAEVCPTNVRGRDGVGPLYNANPRAYCYKVTYLDRGPSAPYNGPTCHNLGQNIDVDYSTGVPLAPCPPTRYGVPRWLQKLNQAFIDAGFLPPTQEELEAILHSPGNDRH